MNEICYANINGVDRILDVAHTFLCDMIKLTSIQLFN